MEEINIKYDEKGLVPAIIQDIETGKVLMLAYMNEKSLNKTIETGKTWFFSRSRKKLWNKGETSGNCQTVEDIKYDCDGDTLLILVKQNGPACHTGSKTCFFNIIKKTESPKWDDSVLESVAAVIKNRKDNPIEGSYTNYLLTKGVDKICKKVGEESSEVIIAAKNNSKEELTYEISDLVYHVLVLMEDRGVKIEDIKNELRKREK
ncbi:MAG: bifunctional phosphoribosyl-AMP cyclohydrolase/phosphoribosyl-ATP diphosphatase HisIE [Bacillota bacterium]|nr:bifunctional phosphoribosyl-AMP cyclohydrolase/phosphoribosyl-ATP diphosphatase HisIE [Bacillota bacterium]